MVQLLLDSLKSGVGAGGERKEEAVECIHLDARYSSSNDDIGSPSFGKVVLALRYAFRAIALRFRHGVRVLYYIPPFPSRSPIYRDFLVLGLCRPFFGRLIYHWHAVGLGEWMEKEARPWERWLCRLILSRPDLSIVLRPFNRTDAELLRSKRVVIVPNGIPDPCPDFEQTILPRRLARAAARRQLLGRGSLDTVEPVAGRDPEVFRLLYLGMCYSGKGLFDAVEAAAIIHRELKSKPIRFQLVVAGSFWLAEEKEQFERRIRGADLQSPEGPVVDFRGFVSGAAKREILAECDALCFPTKMPESFGLVLLEGMAFGLPVVTTRWRNIPEMLPENYVGVVDPGAPGQLAQAVIAILGRDPDPRLRPHFMEHYTVGQFGQGMRRALVEFAD